MKNKEIIVGLKNLIMELSIETYQTEKNGLVKGCFDFISKLEDNYMYDQLESYKEGFDSATECLVSANNMIKERKINK